MNLEYPEPEEEDDEFQHPIPEETVEAVLESGDSLFTVLELHAKLEVVQAAFVNELQQGRLYDPLLLFGRVGAQMEKRSSSTYMENLYLEEGRHPFTQTNSAVEESPLTFGVWSAVADLLNAEEGSDDLEVVKECHEREYREVIDFQTDYATSGFVVGLPEMYRAGIRTEQRVFSALAGSGLESAKIVDVYGNRVSHPSDVDWAEKRGVSRSSVSQSRTEASDFLSKSYPTGTVPKHLIPNTQSP